MPHVMCLIKQLKKTDNIPRKELKGQLETVFEGTQLVNITAEASIPVVISRTKPLQANNQRRTLLQ